jgi:hypothetical protein
VPEIRLVEIGSVGITFTTIYSSLYDNNDTTDCCVDIRYRWCSPIDNKMYPTPQGLSLTFEQFDKLKDVGPFHYIAFCPLRYVPQILMSILSECARDTPSRNRVRWDYIHHNIWLPPLKQGAIEMYFPLIRWKMFETYLEDVDEAVGWDYIHHNIWLPLRFGGTCNKEGSYSDRE